MSMATAFCGPERISSDFITGVTHHLINKTRDRRADWESVLSTTASSDAPDISRFFKGTGAPQLDLHPAPSSSSSSSKDSTYGRFREWGLPSEAQIQGQITGEAPSSGSFKLKEDELITRILRDKGEGEGSGRVEDMKRVIKAVVDKHGEKDKEGYLGWRRSKL